MNLKEYKLDFERKMKSLKHETGALYYAYKDKETPIYAKIVAMIVVAYALSPIDLIPDFIPVLGYLDDIILLPLGIGFAINLIPEEIMKRSRIKSEHYFDKSENKNWLVGGIIIIIWLFVIYEVIVRII